MIDKNQLLSLLLKARTKTYAGAGGKIKPKLKGSVQLEFSKGKWFYRDVYYIGNGIFFGMDVVYFKEKPVFGSSYYGNFKKITEEEADKILRNALMTLWNKTRLWKKVKWKHGKYNYSCKGSGNIEEMCGKEQISKRGKIIFTFHYRGGLIAEK